MKVLVIGSRGFLGRAVCDVLLEKDINFIAHQRPYAGDTNAKIGNTVFWDMMTPFSQNEIIPHYKDVTHVINCAGETSFSKKEQNGKLNAQRPIEIATVYGDVPVYNVGTAWTNCYPNLVQNEYLKCKAYSEDYLIDWCENVTMIKPSIITSHDNFGYIPTDQFFGLIQYMAYKDAYLSMQNKQVDVVSVDWCARSIVELMLKPHLKYKQYNLSAWHDSPTLDELFSCYNEVTWLGGPSEKEERKVTRAIEMYRPFVELEAIFDNSNLMEEGIEPPTSVWANNKRYVSNLQPKTIKWFCN